MTDNESEFRWIVTDRGGHCKLCSVKLSPGDQVLYSWKQRVVWCRACASSFGQVPTDTTKNTVEQSVERKNQESPPSSVVPSAPVELVACDTCRAKVPRGTLTHVIRVSGSEVDLMICERCQWLYQAQWGMKLHGMWRPTPKPTSEVKP